MEVEIAPGHLRWEPAFQARVQVVDPAYSDATVGAIIEKAAKEASAYPNKIRYGDSIRHFPSELILKMVLLLVQSTKHKKVS